MSAQYTPEFFCSNNRIERRALQIRILYVLFYELNRSPNCLRKRNQYQADTSTATRLLSRRIWPQVFIKSDNYYPKKVNDWLVRIKVSKYCPY